MGNPLVSVCVQTYHHSKYIGECLNSILNQETSFDFEVIIGEDESNDGTREICLGYQKKYPKRIRLFLRNRKDVIYINNKPTGRYNLIENLKAANGTYIALCEGDDFWTDSSKLQKQIDFLEQNEETIACFHNANIEYAYPKSLFKKKYFRNPSIKNEFLTSKELLSFGESVIPTASLVYRNLENLELPSWINQVFAGDLTIALTLSTLGNFYYSREIMSTYRKTKTGLSSINSIENKIYSRIFLYENLLEIFEKDEDRLIILKTIKGYRSLGSTKSMIKKPLYFLQTVFAKLNLTKYQTKF